MWTCNDYTSLLPILALLAISANRRLESLPRSCQTFPLADRYGTDQTDSPGCSPCNRLCIIRNLRKANNPAPQLLRQFPPLQHFSFSLLIQLNCCALSSCLFASDSPRCIRVPNPTDARTRNFLKHTTLFPHFSPAF